MQTAYTLQPIIHVKKKKIDPSELSLPLNILKLNVAHNLHL